MCCAVFLDPKQRGLDRHFTKDYKMRRAPRVLCFHLDRIAGIGVLKREDPVRFPELLDMAPYLGGVEQEGDMVRMVQRLVCLFDWMFVAGF